MIEVRRLRPEDNQQSFCSGQPDLDRFFYRYAGQNQFRHYIGVTYVAVDTEAPGQILGYATVAGTQIACTDLPAAHRARLPAYPLPALRLARLAVHEAAQGRGVGQRLLKAVFIIARRQAEAVGCVAILVDARPDAVGFYARFGFVPLAEPIVAGRSGDRPAPTPMVLGLRDIPGPR